jgi:thioredoxin 1
MNSPLDLWLRTAGSWKITIESVVRMKQNSAPGKINGLTELANPGDISTYLSKDKKTIVLFEMTGCPFCRIFQSAFLTFAEKHSEDCALLRVKLDDDSNPLWQKYEIEAVPTVILFFEGQIVARADSILALGLSHKKWTDFCGCF